MGLDLLCGSMSIKLGSYGYVHVQRWGWLQANKEYLLSTKKMSKEEVESLFQPCLLSKSERSPRLNYPYIQKTLEPHLLPGVFTFVYQSDCEGYWTPDECQSMLDAIELLRPYFLTISELKENMEEKEYYLEQIFQHSVHTSNEITLC